MNTDSDYCRLAGPQAHQAAKNDPLVQNGSESLSACVVYDGPASKWRERVVGRAFIELGIEQPRLAWPTPKCGTERCTEFAHIAWESPRELAYPKGVCIYCGAIANARDHLLPRTWTGNAVRRHVLTVPACHGCNSAISDRYAPSITERRIIAHRYIAKKYRRVLAIPPWTKADIAELGPTLRSSITRGLFEQQLARARLYWPEEPDYDLRVMHLSGIANPYEIGLLTKESEAA